MLSSIAAAGDRRAGASALPAGGDAAAGAAQAGLRQCQCAAGGIRERGFGAAIAIPSYRDYIVRSKRAAARQVLMEAAQFLERNFTAAGSGTSGIGGATQLESILSLPGSGRGRTSWREVLR